MPPAAHTHTVGVPEAPRSLCRPRGPGETQLLLLSPGSVCFFREYLSVPLEEDTRPTAPHKPSPSSRRRTLCSPSCPSTWLTRCSRT